MFYHFFVRTDFKSVLWEISHYCHREIAEEPSGKRIRAVQLISLLTPPRDRWIEHDLH